MSRPCWKADYAAYADYEDYADYADYADFADYAEYEEYAEYADYAKFTLLSYQVCHNYPVASWEGGASSVVSGPGRMIEVDHCLKSLERKPPIVFWLVRIKISCMNTFISLVEPILPLTDQNTPLWSLLKVSRSVVGFKQPTRA